MVRNPHGVVVIVGESELEGIKRQVGFTVLEKILSTSTPIEVPKIPEQSKNEWVCEVCGHEGHKAMDLSKHRKKEHNLEWSTFPSKKSST